MSDTQNMIKSVDNNNEKYLSYKENIKRYNKAKISEFYFECIWILYAMIEDRTSAFLYYLGFTSENKRNSVTGCKKIKHQVRQILNMKNDEKYKFDSLFGKLSRIEQLVAWSSEDLYDIYPYQKDIKYIIKKILEDESFIKSIRYLNNEWRNKRNQLMHALFNKKYDEAIEELKPLVENGYNAVRKIDSSVKQLKKAEIRKKYKIR